MGWRLKANKDSWSLHHIIDKGRDKETGKKRRPSRALSPSELIANGFDPKWTFTQAQDFYRSSFQANESKKRDAEKKAKAKARELEFQRIQSAYLPEAVVDAFELFLLKRFGVMEKVGNKNRLVLPDKIKPHWHAAQKLVQVLDIDPTEYGETPEVVYRYAISQQYSPSWLKKVLRFLNLWGYFYCKRRDKAFLPIPSPTGKWREALNEAYFDNRKDGLESSPLTPEMLENIKRTEDEKENEKMKMRHWLWLHISVWLGLRPREIDRMKNDTENKYHVIVPPDSNGIRYLRVYQPKLISLSRERRWKTIPILFSEQEKALETIQSQNFQRPLTKTIHNYISPKHNTYAGRKNFFDLMLRPEMGPQTFENISMWLGHTTLDRSLRNYKRKDVVQYVLPPKPPKAPTPINGRKLRSVGKGKKDAA